MKQQTMQLTLREFSRLAGNSRLRLAFIIVVGLFVFTGPFGTFDRLSFIERTGFWLTVQLVTWTISLLAISFVSAVVNKDGKPLGLRETVLGCLLAVPFIAVAVELIQLLFLGFPVSIGSVSLQVVETVPVALAIGLIAYFFMTSSAAVPTKSAAPANRLMLRLPAEKRGRLLHMTMQDHYVEVVTENGSELVLLRLADAIAETGEMVGYQIHRSHWVAASAISKVSRDKGKPFVETSGGARLPVSRTYLPALKEAGIVPR